MSEANTNQDLLSTLYCAATDSRQWSKFCQHLNQVSECPVTMFGHSLVSGQSLGYVAGGWDKTWLQSYADYYGAFNPWMDLNVAMKPGMIGVSDTVTPRAELYQTEYYNDWLQPQEDLVAGVAMICHHSKDRFLALGAACRNSHVDKSLPRLEKLLGILAPHIYRAINISSTLSGNNGATAAHLDSSRFAVFLIHSSGRIGYQNPAATRLLQQQDVLKLGRDERLTAVDESTRQQISVCLAAITNKAIENLPPPAAITLSGNKKMMLHAHIFPDKAELSFPESIWSDPPTGCLVITGLGGLGDVNSIEMLQAGFCATTAEARLGQAIMAGLSLYDYADHNSISRHTMRNQMRALLSKTGCRNQPDFIRKIAALISPFEVL